ncbi:putative bifunctional diguanylate cyclase/phosphodiesterase [Colwellia sp. 20A7]|uniref:putative bifunctional diguanylate cyclase/phosphodiesterase n=1 Tax=Colwellia sp. 20A7 TaxID=2689569 RepID=UPI00135939F0|nr:GGDEF domain-containing phosphodiesterase [Colwellia sp. 20A7]
MFFSIAFACYYMGLHGIVYAFPAITGLFFLTSIRTALLIAIPSIFLYLVLTMLHGEVFETFRLLPSLVLTIIFTAYSAYYSRKQKDAVGEEAKKDPLTGLANRHSYNKWLDECHLNTNIRSITSINLDIDKFRIINDTLGFDVGDELIQQLSKKLSNVIENDMTLTIAQSYYFARYSGDSFAIGLTNLPEEFDIFPFINRLKLAVNELKVISKNPIKISASIAIVRANRLKGKFQNIIDNVDITLKQAKQLGDNSIQVFDESINKQFKEQKHIAQELTQALNNNEFHMVFMPIFRHDKNNIAGAELLLRCDRDELKEYGPDKFIPIAESTGLIEQIDYWVLNESFKIIANTDMLKIPSIEFYSINISSKQLHNKNFILRIKQILNQYDLDPTIIELEITETSLVESDLQAVDTLISLRRIGFKLSLDDFGTGYTSFNQLKKFPLNNLKIDRSFVSGDLENTSPLIGMSLVILSIAKLYNFSVIAEGVETEKQYLELKNNGCEYFQGYWFSKPITVKEFVYMIAHTDE